MNGPRRILDGGGDELAMTLLRAAKHDNPEPDAKMRMLATLGVGAAVVGTAATASATAGASAKLGAAGGVATAAAAGTGKSTLAVVVAKWLVLGALGGGLVAGSAVALDAPEATALTTTQSIAQGKGAAEQIVRRAQQAALSETQAANAQAEKVAALADTVAEPKADAPATAHTNNGSKSTSEGLAEELALLDKARVAVRAGQSSKALQVLDEHDRRFAGGQLAPEALVLRIEALVGAGRTSEAARLGDAYLAAFPKSAYARRVRSLLGRAEAEGGGSATP